MSFFVSHLPASTLGYLTDSARITEANPAPFRNTKEIIIYNPNEDHRLLVRFADPADLTNPPAVGDLTTNNSLIVPVQSSVTYAIGPEGEREPMENTNNALYAGQISLFFTSETSAGPLDHGFQVTYVQCRGDL